MFKSFFDENNVEESMQLKNNQAMPLVSATAATKTPCLLTNIPSGLVLASNCKFFYQYVTTGILCEVVLGAKSF